LRPGYFYNDYGEEYEQKDNSHIATYLFDLAVIVSMPDLLDRQLRD
jgi:hypothetical protein